MRLKVMEQRPLTSVYNNVGNNPTHNNNINGNILNSPKRLNTVQNSNVTSTTTTTSNTIAKNYNNNKLNLTTSGNLKNYDVEAIKKDETAEDAIIIKELTRKNYNNNINANQTEWRCERIERDASFDQRLDSSMSVDNDLKTIATRKNSLNQSYNINDSISDRTKTVQGDDVNRFDYEDPCHDCVPPEYDEVEDEEELEDEEEEFEFDDEEEEDDEDEGIEYEEVVEHRRHGIAGIVNPNYPGFQHFAHTLQEYTIKVADSSLTSTTSTSSSSSSSSTTTSATSDAELSEEEAIVDNENNNSCNHDDLIDVEDGKEVIIEAEEKAEEDQIDDNRLESLINVKKVLYEKQLLVNLIVPAAIDANDLSTVDTCKRDNTVDEPLSKPSRPSSAASSLHQQEATAYNIVPASSDYQLIDNRPSEMPQVLAYETDESIRLHDANDSKYAITEFANAKETSTLRDNKFADALLSTLEDDLLALSEKFDEKQEEALEKRVLIKEDLTKDIDEKENDEAENDVGDGQQKSESHAKKRREVVATDNNNTRNNHHHHHKHHHHHHHKNHHHRENRQPLVAANGQCGDTRSPELIETFDVYNIETAMPKIDLDAIECHLRAAREEERRRRTDREEIRRRLAMGNEEDYYSNSDRPGRKPSLQSRLQSGMNLQICFMNETASDTESPSSDSECPMTNPKDTKSASSSSLSTSSSPKIVNEENQWSDRMAGFNGPIATRPATLSIGQQQQQQFTNETDFFARQARLQTEARMALAQAKEMARMQMEIERQRLKKSPITEMVRNSLEKVGIQFPEDRRRLSRQILTEMNVAQLQVIVNDLHTQIESLNEKLVKYLMDRDDLHMEQDSMLVDIEDLTRYLGAKEQTKDKSVSPQNNNNSGNNNNGNITSSLSTTATTTAAASPLTAAAVLNSSVKPHLNRIANFVKK